MPFEPFAPPPLLTGDLPGIGGRIKAEPEDFVVEEVPAYAPCGEGDYLYLWIEKRDMGAEYFVRQLARRLDIGVGEVGTAGLKDRRAVSRQMVSVPRHVESMLDQVNGDGIKLLNVNRHKNKLRPGHLHGNRFEILIRGSTEGACEHLLPIVARIKDQGLPNFYGPQRFGRGGETLRLGLALVRGESLSEIKLNARNPFLRKLALSAAQSALFNHYLAERMTDGLLRTVLAGDVMAKVPFGGMFIAEDVVAEQVRFDARETVTAGPLFGKKTFPASGEAAKREARVLEEANLSVTSFKSFGKLMMGTRRHNLTFVNDLAAVTKPEGVQLTFSLPAGAYATNLLREITRSGELAEGEEA